MKTTRITKSTWTGRHWRETKITLPWSPDLGVDDDAPVQQQQQPVQSQKRRCEPTHAFERMK
ncbi:MAG: hypothetical protein GEU91_19155 [Rhizobiales bacterium]|nr:hypothetical protein [Hyphomicrobiales bacterium]